MSVWIVGHSRSDISAVVVGYSCPCALEPCLFLASLLAAASALSGCSGDQDLTPTLR